MKKVFCRRCHLYAKNNTCLVGKSKSKCVSNMEKETCEAPGMVNLTLHLHFSQLHVNWRVDTLPAHSLGRKRQEPICRAT